LKGDVFLLYSVVDSLANLLLILTILFALVFFLMCIHLVRFYSYLMKNNPELGSYILGNDVYGFFKRYRVPIRSYKYFFSDKGEEDEVTKYYKQHFRLLNKILLGLIICILLIFIISTVVLG